MALLTTQAVNLAGATPTYAAAAGGGDTFVPSNNSFIHVKNTSGGAITVTVVTPGTVQGQAIADLAVSVPATTGDKMIGPLPGGLFTNQSTGVGNITYSGVTNLTIAVLELDPTVA